MIALPPGGVAEGAERGARKPCSSVLGPESARRVACVERKWYFKLDFNSWGLAQNASSRYA